MQSCLSFNHRNVVKERRHCFSNVSGLLLGSSRPYAAATGCYRAAKQRPRGRAPPGRKPRVSAHSCDAPCRKTTIATTPNRLQRKCPHAGAAASIRSVCHGTFSPTAFSLQPCSSLSRHGLEASQFASRVGAAASLDSPCARLLSAIAGRGEETGIQVEQRN